MKTPLAALLVITLAVSGCSSVRQSRMNPMNWFGGSRQEAAPTLGQTSDTIDNRALVASVASLSIEPTSSGALIRAEALMPSAGWWDAELVPENFGRPEDGVLTFRFVAAAPREPVPGSSERARTIVAAYPMTQAQLDTTSQVVVTGETNSRRASR
ncbi:hypothetical protein [Pararhodobacter oceanensis]|uniref:hypothetical protein n=1 Tax=Pararhodobacter oceanensis TaxID=2172121 RepID=UPI003A8D3A38